MNLRLVHFPIAFLHYVINEGSQVSVIENFLVTRCKNSKILPANKRLENYEFMSNHINFKPIDHSVSKTKYKNDNTTR